jgi:hypothetical protein
MVAVDEVEDPSPRSEDVVEAEVCVSFVVHATSIATMQAAIRVPCPRGEMRPSPTSAIIPSSLPQRCRASARAPQRRHHALTIVAAKRSA